MKAIFNLTVNLTAWATSPIWIFPFLVYHICFTGEFKENMKQMKKRNMFS